MVYTKLLMAMGVIGFILSAVFVAPKSEAAGFLFTLFFTLLFLESFVTNIQTPKPLKNTWEVIRSGIHMAPLPSGYMLSSIIGFLVSTMYIGPVMSINWGTTLAVFFLIIFIASVVSMHTVPSGNPLLEEQHMRELAIHNKHGRH